MLNQRETQREEQGGVPLEATSQYKLGGPAPRTTASHKGTEFLTNPQILILPGNFKCPWKSYIDFIIFLTAW